MMSIVFALINQTIVFSHLPLQAAYVFDQWWIDVASIGFW